MLQIGDQILYVNNNSLKNRPLNEVYQLLCLNEEVVKLKIKKDEQFAQEEIEIENKNNQAMNDKVVVYTVELQRNGGPLGITISGSDDLYEPLHVSALTEGGLAERTNAIHIGDTILAINNVSLRGKTLNEAIELLKNSDDIVNLKISRKLDSISKNNNSKINNINQNGNGYIMRNIESDTFSDNMNGKYLFLNFSKTPQTKNVLSTFSQIEV
jgi:C-terminal processing protease CtpA/Prc